MEMSVRPWASILALSTVIGTLACDRAPLRGLGEPRVAGGTPARLGMAALHAGGGVPAGWRFTPPPGDVATGRDLFAGFGCHTCHVVRGEQFPPFERRAGDVLAGPELTGTGNHHPAGYFAEAIVNPQAVLVDGPGYIGADGRSIMPDYADMSLAELADLVAYLQSLKSGGGTHAHPHDLPATPMTGSTTCTTSGAAAYLLQIQTVTNEELRAIDEWFGGPGGLRLRQAEGVTTASLYVSRTPAGRTLVTVFGFEDEGQMRALARRLAEPDPAGAYGGLAAQGPALLYRSPVLYGARGLGDGGAGG